MMKNSLILAREALLDPAGLTESQLQVILGRLLTPKVDMADLYFQATQLSKKKQFLLLSKVFLGLLKKRKETSLFRRRSQSLIISKCKK